MKELFLPVATMKEQGLDGVDYGLVKRTGMTHSLKKVVCATCNSGWMSRVQKLVKPVLGYMIVTDESASSELDYDGAVAVCLWLVMTAMVYDFADAKPHPVLLAGVPSHLRPNSPPPPWIWALVGRRRLAGQPAVYFGQGTLDLAVMNGSVATQLDGHVFNVVIGHAVLQLIHIPDEPELLRELVIRRRDFGRRTPSGHPRRERHRLAP
ncbi:MAG: hypothetical protein V9G12_20040 [Microthrixaceae bacterium]